MFCGEVGMLSQSIGIRLLRKASKRIPATEPRAIKFDSASTTSESAARIEDLPRMRRSASGSVPSSSPPPPASLSAKILKTGLAAATVYGTARAVEAFRSGGSAELPEFDDDVSARAVQLCMLDHTLFRSMHRCYAVAKREENLRHFPAFEDALIACAKAMEASVIKEELKEGNGCARVASKKIDAFVRLFKKDALVFAVLEDDAQLVKACVQSHIQNEMIDRFF